MSDPSPYSTILHSHDYSLIPLIRPLKPSIVLSNLMPVVRDGVIWRATEPKADATVFQLAFHIFEQSISVVKCSIEFTNVKVGVNLHRKTKPILSMNKLTGPISREAELYC